MSRRSSPPKINEGKQEIPERLITDLLTPDMIEEVANQLSKMGSLRPWLQVSKGTNKYSKPIGNFDSFLNAPVDIQNLILQEIGYKDVGNLLSVSNYVNKSLKSKKIKKIEYFDENKEYQKSKYSRFYDLIRNTNGGIITTPDLYQTTLTNKQISESIITCFCPGLSLSSIPPLPKCKILNCANNNLTTLPKLPNCEYLKCESNILFSLPPLPKIIKLSTVNNPLPPELLFDEVELNEPQRKNLNNWIKWYSVGFV
jgi:hypothetical protein